MGVGGSRSAAIFFIAAAAVLAGVGHATGQRWLVAIAFGLFALGAGAFMRWRATEQGRVLDREEKTRREDGTE
jgi:hypothetical protein